MLIKNINTVPNDLISFVQSNSDYLTESESSYGAEMVPVINNKDGYIISLEDITSYAEANGITDLGRSLEEIYVNHLT
jgi:hypothetical protein